jgi:DNA primase catalytic subunit
MQYDYPAGLKPTPVEKRELFYREEFPREQVAKRIGRWYRFIPAIDVGSESTLYKPRLSEFKGKLVRISEYNDIDHLAEKFVDYAPEDIYYNRTIEKDGEVHVDPDQELVFRIAPFQLECHGCDRKREYMDKSQHQNVFCLDCLGTAGQTTKELYGFLKRHFNDMDIVFAGRGFNIHVNEEEGYQMGMEDRRELANKVAQEFPIDKDITAAGSSPFRLP